jgi:hypothetical protein
VTSYSGTALLGLVFVGPNGSCTPQASPSKDMFLCSPGTIATVAQGVVAAIEDIKKATPLERIAKVKEFCGQERYSLAGLLGRFAEKSLQP